MERHRPDLKSEGLGNQEIMKHLADMWHKASWDEKAECQKEADKDRERYERELKDYVPTPVEAQREVRHLDSLLVQLLCQAEECSFCGTNCAIVHDWKQTREDKSVISKIIFFFVFSLGQETEEGQRCP